MALSTKELAAAMLDANKTAFKANASRRAGAMFNERVTNIIAPKLPLMMRGYKDEPWFQFVLANAVAAAVVKFGGSNDKLLMLADAGITAANDSFLGSFDFEGMINGVVDGIDVSGLTRASDATRDVAASGLRKAADVVDTDAASA